MRAQIMTAFSEHAHVIADTFRAAFVTSKVGDHVAEMTAPKDSTKGGKLALQHVVLKGPTGRALVVGAVNAHERRAQLKSYKAVAELHQERFARALSFDEPAYLAFVETATSVLSAFGVEVVLTDSDVAAPPMSLSEPRVATPADPPRKSRLLLTLVIAVVMIAITGFVIWRYALR
jgi:hypothetical protein